VKLTKIVLIVLLAEFLLAITTCSPKAGDGVPAINPDPRVQWVREDVSGYLLTRRVSPDSVTSIVLPWGAVLWLPRLVPDTTGTGPGID